MLLKQDDINHDDSDKYGSSTPLSEAAGNEQEGVVMMLLEGLHVNHNPVDEDGQKPLFGATKEGQEGVVQMLLE